MEVDLRVRPRTVLVVVSVVFLIQLTFALMAIFVPADGAFVNFLYRRAAFDSERSISAFFSFVLLLLCSLLLAVIAIQQRGADSRWQWHWVGLVCLFVILAYDEAASLHEALIEPLRDQLGVGGWLYLAWVIPGLVFVALIGAFYLPFLIALPPFFGGLFLVAGGTYIAGALGMEMIGGRYLDQHLPDASSAQIAADQNYQLLTTVEEGLEMIGAIVFIYALMRFLTVQAGTLTIHVKMEW